MQAYVALHCEQCVKLQTENMVFFWDLPYKMETAVKVHKVPRSNALAALNRYIAERRGIAYRPQLNLSMRRCDEQV